MGLSGKGDGNKAYFLKVGGLKKGSTEPAHFVAKTKSESGSYEEVNGMFFQVEGRFDGVKVGSYTHEGEEIKYVSLTVIDDSKKEKYILNLGFNNLTTGILNSLANTEVGQLMIRLYNNDKGYPSTYIEINGEKAEWSLDFKELNGMKKEVKVGSKVIVDRSELDAYLVEKVIPTIKVDALAMATASMEQEGIEDKSKDMKALHEEPSEEMDDEDDLPF